MNGRVERIGTSVAAHPAAPYLFLSILSLLLYGRTAGFELLPTWDDADYILHNPLITRSFSLSGLRAIFTTPVMGNYAPLHILANALQFRFWGTDPAGYHLVSTLLHATNACLLFSLLRRMTVSKGISFWAALLFAVHPVNIENVAWVSEQKTLFATAFGLAATFLYLQYGVGKRPASLVLASTAFLVSLLFKVSLLPLPLVLAAWELVHRRLRAAWAALVPFFLLALFAAGLAVWAQMRGGAVEQGALALRFLFGTVYPTMAPALWNYLRLVLFPVGLSAYYDTTLYTSFLALPVLASLVAMVLFLSLIARKGSPHVRFWTFWACAFLLPVTNIIPLPVYYADRYLYLPAVGLFVLTGIAGESVIRRAMVPAAAVRVAAMTVVVALAMLSFARLAVWRNDQVLWEDTVSRSPGLYKPHLNLGIVYDRAGRYAEAERELLASLAIRSTEKARYYLAAVRAKKEYTEHYGEDRTRSR